MEKLKSFLVTRLLLVLAVTLAAEGAAALLVGRVLLPFTAAIASDRIVNRIAVILLLLVSFALLVLPVAFGVLWYAGRVAERVGHLEQEREAERARADEQRNLMISDFAHDLRTPIMTISGYAGALADGMVKEEEQKKEYLEAIRTKSGRMSELINLLFDYARLGSANFHLNKEKTDLNELLREAAATAFSDLEGAGMTLIAEIPEEPYFVMADRAQCARIFANLLVNVIRHNPAGTEAAVSVKRLAGLEMIAFADTGVRIEKSGEELFEPFVKGDDARHESAGSGLGLSIVKKITDMHGWGIELRQPFGNFTKAFVVRVPER